MNLLGNTATVCSPAGALASNFVVTVSPDTVSKGDVVSRCLPMGIMPQRDCSCGNEASIVSRTGLRYPHSGYRCA